MWGLATVGQKQQKNLQSSLDLGLVAELSRAVAASHMPASLALPAGLKQRRSTSRLLRRGLGSESHSIR